jgi:hypothetical protein
MCGFERVTHTDEECGVRCTRSLNWWPRLVHSVMPGHLYPAIQVVRPLATAVWVADSPYESSSEAPVEENRNSGWVGLAGAPLESGAS